MAKDPGKPDSLYKKCLANPRKVMEDEELDPEVINAVMDGDLDFLNDLLKGTKLICGTLIRI